MKDKEAFDWILDLYRASGKLPEGNILDFIDKEKLSEENRVFYESAAIKEITPTKIEGELKKKQFDLNSTVIIFMMWFLSGLAFSSFVLYYFFPDSAVMENLVSQVVISCISSAFSIVGTLFGLRQQNDLD